MPVKREELRLYPSSAGMDPEAMRPGRDLVLDLPVADGLRVPDGVLIDDHLDHTARLAVDQVADAAIGRWREAFDSLLEFPPVALGDIWHSELLAEVFLPVARVAGALKRLAETTDLGGLVCHRLDPELVTALREMLPDVTVEVAEAGTLQRYPGADAAPSSTAARAPGWQRATRGLLDICGLPSLRRGSVVVIGYGATQPVLERLAADGGPAPVFYMPFPPAPRILLGALRHAGWLGLPGLRRRRTAARQLAAALQRAAAVPPPAMIASGLDRLLHARALRCLSDRAGPSLALADYLHAQFRRISPGSVLVPFDHEPLAKVLVRTAQAHGVPVLALQHGYEPVKRFHPGENSDVLGQWSRWDLAALPPCRRRRARVVGNPARGTIRRTDRPTALTPTAVVLAEHPGRLSALIDRRITAQHLTEALAGLSRSGRPWKIIVRPHPADDPAQFRELVRAEGGDPECVDAATPMLELLDGADICIGAFSTAALQTALTATELIMLMPQPTDCVPPLDGSRTLRVVGDAASLAAALGPAPRPADLRARQELLEALGHGEGDPTTSIIKWLIELGARPQHLGLRPEGAA